MHTSFVKSDPVASGVHRYAVQKGEGGWTLTRDGRPVGAFATRGQACSIAERIAADIGRAGVAVELSLPEGARW